MLNSSKSQPRSARIPEASVGGRAQTRRRPLAMAAASVTSALAATLGTKPGVAFAACEETFCISSYCTEWNGQLFLCWHMADTSTREYCYTDCVNCGGCQEP